jgi:hypothetical protein
MGYSIGMVNNTEALGSAEYLRLLWEGLHQALATGMDTADVAAVSGAIERLAEDRLIYLSHHSADAATVAAVRSYRDKAADLRKKASQPPPELDFEKLAEERAAARDASGEGSGGEHLAGRS